MTNRRVNVDTHPGRNALEAFSIFGAHPFTLTEIAAFALVPDLGTRFLAATPAWVLLWVPFFIAQELVRAALVYAAASFTDMTVTAPADVLEAYRTALTKLRDIVEQLLRLGGATLLLAITIVGIPWAIRLLVRWNFAVYAIILNDLNAKQAISFSCDLVTGRWWQIFGLGVATLAPGVLIYLALLILAQSPLAGLIYTAAYTLVAGPLIATFWTFMFLELRAGHPAYQAEVMCAT